MNRDDIIEAMADALVGCEGMPAYDVEYQRAAARAALTAIEALGVRLVPGVATKEMLEFCGADRLVIETGLWDAMLDASPLRPDEERSETD